MVVKFQRLNDDHEQVEMGRIHNGEILSAQTDEFRETYERIKATESEYIERRHRNEMREPENDLDTTDRRRSVGTRPPVNIYDEDSLVQRFKPPYGVYGSISPPEEDRERLEEVAARDTASTTPAKPDSTEDVAIRLFLWGRDTPGRIVRILGDGYVRLDVRGGPLRGKYVFELTDGTVSGLVDRFYDEAFFELNSTYISDDDTPPITALSIDVGDHEQWVYNYSTDPPAAFATLRSAIERTVALDYWEPDQLSGLVEGIANGSIQFGPGLAAARAIDDAETTYGNRPPELYEVVRSAFTAERATTRRDAVRLLRDGSVEEMRTEVPELADLLGDDDREVQRGAAETLSALAEAHPEDVVPIVPQLRAVLGNGGADGSTSANSWVQSAVSQALSEVAAVDPGAVVDAIPALAPLLDHRSDEIRETVLHTLCRVGAEYPDELMPVVPQLQEFVAEGEFPVSATSALGRVAKEYPDVAEPLIETFKSRLTASDYQVRNNALAALADLAREYPDAVVSESDRYTDLLDDEDNYVRYNATSVLSRLARTHPETIRDATDGLVAQLDEDHDQTRANACWALGRLGADAATSRLRELRDHDPAEVVQAGAIAGLEMIEANECPYCTHRVRSHEMDVTVVYPEWIQWDCPNCGGEVSRDI